MDKSILPQIACHQGSKGEQGLPPTLNNHSEFIEGILWAADLIISDRDDTLVVAKIRLQICNEKYCYACSSLLGVRSLTVRNKMILSDEHPRVVTRTDTTYVFCKECYDVVGSIADLSLDRTWKQINNIE